MHESHFLEPVEFFLSPKLLSGWTGDGMDQDVDIVRDLGLAMQLENSQDLPEGYCIWSDYFPNAVAPFYTTALGQKGRQIVEEHGATVWAQLGNFQIELRKKKVRKTITEFEEFWLVTAFDILEQLKMISVGRFCASDYDNSSLESVFRVFLSGLYPCGQKTDGRLVAFDPKVLMR
jgi:hypothetical protein